MTYKLIVLQKNDKDQWEGVTNTAWLRFMGHMATTHDSKWRNKSFRIAMDAELEKFQATYVMGHEGMREIDYLEFADAESLLAFELAWS